MIQPLDESYFEKEENEQSGGIGSAKGMYVISVKPFQIKIY
jgi:hypothetical protein